MSVSISAVKMYHIDGEMLADYQGYSHFTMTFIHSSHIYVLFNNSHVNVVILFYRYHFLSSMSFISFRWVRLYLWPYSSAVSHQ